MSEELSTLIQVLQLYGRGLDGLGKAIRFTSKGVKKGANFATLKKMQIKMKLHYASMGEHKTMKLRDLEKLTNGKYSIYNIPIEDEKFLMQFYDRLKKVKVAFAELPDLQLGDGYTQIAFNPLDADKVELVVNYFRKKFNQEAREITLDDYISTGGKDGEQMLTDLAKKGYKNTMNEEQLKEIQLRIKSKDYQTISVNLDSLLVREEKDSFIVKLPGYLRDGNDGGHVRLMKRDVLLIDGGMTCVSTFKMDERVNVFMVDDGGIPIKSSLKQVDSDKILKRFDVVSKNRIKGIGNLKSNQTEIFPNFNQGQDSTMKDVDLPDFYAEEKITNIMDVERFKSMSQDENYQQLSIDIESSFVAEDENNYVIYVPEIFDSKDEVLDCMVINKNDARISVDGKSIIAYLDKNKESSIHRFDKNGKEVKVFEMKNPDIALAYVKAESEKSLKKNASLIKSFNTPEKSKKITNNLIKSMGKKV